MGGSPCPKKRADEPAFLFAFFAMICHFAPFFKTSACRLRRLAYTNNFIFSITFIRAYGRRRHRRRWRESVANIPRLVRVRGGRVRPRGACLCEGGVCQNKNIQTLFWGGVLVGFSVCGTRMLFFDGIGTARPLFLANHLRLLSIHQQHMDVVYVQLAMLTRFSLLPPLSSHAYLPSPRRL